jgi:uncharacterized protein (UPF0371 family)
MVTMLAILLVVGNRVEQEALRSLSLQNAKQLLMGDAPEFGVLLHVAATTAEDMNRAISEFAQVEGVTAVSTLALRSQ